MKNLLLIFALLSCLLCSSQRTIKTKYLYVKGVKNAPFLATDSNGKVVSKEFIVEHPNTDLSYTGYADKGVVKSSNGENAEIPIVNSINAGLQSPNFYQENTFTPFIYTGDNPNNQPYTYDRVDAYYSRVGKIVFFTVSFKNINTTGDTDGLLHISGFPFPIKDINTVCSIDVDGVNVRFVSAKAYNNNDSTFIINYKRGSSIYDFDNSMKNVDFTNGKITISGTYITSQF